MAPISKDHEIPTAAPDGAAAIAAPAGARLEDTASRPQPVALEVPVSVNGARTVDGSDKREPFSETTKTVLVFGNGAVIRLGSPVAAGQLLFLTNEKTKKEVVCQVVKSKNYRNVSGYVELEFTESVVGFWGMRFPSDRIGAQAPAAPVKTQAPAKNVSAPPVTVSSRGVTPVVSQAPKIPQASPVQVPRDLGPALQARTLEPVPTAPFDGKPEVTSVQAPATVAPVEKISQLPAIQAPLRIASLTSSVVNLLGVTEVQPASTSTKQPAQPIPFENKTAHASSDHSGELKLQAARLQEQLSSMLFNAAPAATPAPPAPALDSKNIPGVDSKVFEIAKPEPSPVKLAAPARTAPPPIKSTLDTEEVKIPSWLEPLARNAAAASTQELGEREKSRHAADIPAQDEHASETASAIEADGARDIEVPAVGGLLSMDGVLTSRGHSSGGSRTGMWIGMIAAALLLAAGGVWYEFSTSKPPLSTPAPESKVVNNPANPGAQPRTEARPEDHSGFRDATTEAEARSRSAGIIHPSSQSSGEALTKSPGLSPSEQAVRENARESATAIPAAITERISREKSAPEPKKPALGEVHLSAPTMNRSESGQDDGVIAPTISANGANAGSGGLASGLATGSEKQPAAPEIPLPVGGDVKSARLISHVPPVYPTMAKNQHVTGDVVIDALIDTNGRVTTMKVMSGPTLLHQAAKDALHQWKYQPASLDGKPVAMHLTVTLQFRMQ